MDTTVSQEQLTEKEKAEERKREKDKGCFMKKKSLVLLGLIGAALFIGSILITYFSARCESPSEIPKPPIVVPIVDNVRLPSHVMPSSYKISIFPNITGDNVFMGDIVITMQCVQDSNNITLHIDDLKIDKESVKLQEASTKKQISIAEHIFDKQRQFYILKASHNLVAKTEYTLTISYSGSLGDKLAGFYISNYEENGKPHKVGVTQFQATEARKAFPCFDEPKFKAVFTISLARPSTSDWKCFSNMEIDSTTNHKIDGWVWEHFKPSVKMSSYLVAFSVTQFEAVEEPFDNNKKKMHFLARPSAMNQLDLARSIAPKVLDFYQTHFKIDFPLEKCDMMALPDFNAGAMENWGLVTYRETALLFDPKVSTASNNQRVATVIGHELAHQWFGNLVTPVWWTDIWLNEGFASYMEYIAISHVRPKWRMMEQVIIDDVQDVLEMDALLTSHPISQQVSLPEEITELFDRISYGKGASIIRMMTNFLGENGFNKGISAYLDKFKYSNAEQKDLWGFLTDNSEKKLPASMEMIMNTWTLQTGYPVITIKRDYKGKSLTIAQSRFVYNSTVLMDPSQNYKWWVFLTWKGRQHTTVNEMWLSPDAQEYTKEDTSLGESDWLLCNIDQYGFFRVNYDEQNWNLLKEQLLKDINTVSPINRAQILDDSFELAKAGLLSYDIALGMTTYLKKETNYIPLQSALRKLSYISLMLSRKEAFGKFQAYMQDLMKHLYNSDPRLLLDLKTENYDDEDITGVHKAISIFKSACNYEATQDCIDEAQKEYVNWKAKYNEAKPDEPGVPPNMKTTVYCTAIRKGTIEDWNFLWKHQTLTNLASEKKIILGSLACTEEVWILSTYLEWILDPSKIRAQDAVMVFQYVASNKVGRYLAFDFLRNNWVKLSERFSSGISSMDRFVTSVSDGFNTEFEIRQLKEFAKDNEAVLGSAARATEQAIENAETNFQWMAKNYDTIYKWLDQYKPGSP